jgi:hypothetical protein
MELHLDVVLEQTVSQTLLEVEREAWLQAYLKVQEGAGK